MEKDITKLFKTEPIEQQSFSKIKITLASSDKIKSCHLVKLKNQKQ